MDVTPAGIDAAYQLYKYFSAFVADRRARRRAPTTSRPRWVAAESDGERPSPTTQVVGFLFLLIIAGNETTTKLLGNCLLALQRFPDERAKVLADPGRIPDAVEEILRYEGSTQVMARTLTRDVELHGATMREGDKVLLLLGSGEPRRTGLGSSPTCTTSTAAGRRTTSRSGTASTCASARRWRGSRCA